MALYLIAPGHVPAPSDIERKAPAQDDDELTIDVDLEDIETTIKFSLDETRRLVDAAFAKSE